MTYRFVTRSVLAAVVAGLGSLVVLQAQGAAGTTKWCIGCSADGKTTPRAADGHVDLSGYWDAPQNLTFSDDGLEAGHVATRLEDGSVFFDFGGARAAAPAAAGAAGGARAGGAGAAAPAPARPQAAPQPQPSYKPEYQAKVKAIADSMYGGSTPLDPQMDCLPLGAPRAITQAQAPFQLVQTQQLIALLFESSPGPVYRVIYMDGRPHPEDVDSSFMGHSIGRWEGDTLVVDTVALNDKTWLADPRGRQSTTIHSDKMHVVERFTRNGNDLVYQATADDPVMFTQPWVVTRALKHGAPEHTLEEAICTASKLKMHIVKPTVEDPYECNYCAGASRTLGTGVWKEEEVEKGKK